MKAHWNSSLIVTTGGEPRNISPQSGKYVACSHGIVRRSLARTHGLPQLVMLSCAAGSCAADLQPHLEPHLERGRWCWERAARLALPAPPVGSLLGDTECLIMEFAKAPCHTSPSRVLCDSFHTVTKAVSTLLLGPLQPNQSISSKLQKCKRWRLKPPHARLDS